MKTTRINLYASLLLVAGSLMFTDCRKKDKSPEPEPDNEQTTTQDNALAEGSANDVMAMGSQLSENSGSLTTFRSSETTDNLFLLAAGCSTITSNAPQGGTVVATQFTVDFGTTGCEGADKRVRKGKLFFDFSQSTNNAKYYRNPGFKVLISSNGYFVDGNEVIITKTVTNTSPLTIAGQTAYSGTNLTWNIVANVTVNKNGGGQVTWSCNRDKELINSNDANCYKGQLQAIDWTKAKVKLNGTANGVNSRSENYTAKAIDLVRDFTCAPNGLAQPHRHPFVSGKIEYTPGSRAMRLIDYGSGTCDFNATVTINGQVYDITLP